LTQAPTISVIVPTFDRTGSLDECLRALARQTLDPSRFEVIVSDDGSPVPVAESLRATLNELSGRITIRVLRHANSGPAAARNKGAAIAAGQFLAFTDDDCRPRSDWLERLLHRLEMNPLALVGGGLRMPPGADSYARANQAIMDFVYLNQERRPGLRLFSTSNLSISAGGFHRIGGFATAFREPAGEDYDLCARWFASGGNTVYAPDAVVIHQHPLRFMAYVRQHMAYGRGLLQMRRRMRHTGIATSRPGPRVLPAQFYLRLIVSPVASRGISGLSCSALIALSQAATAVGALGARLFPVRTETAAARDGDVRRLS
jgi:glycosyltransferase involved in cell wall biosynthesis